MHNNICAHMRTYTYIFWNAFDMLYVSNNVIMVKKIILKLFEIIIKIMGLWIIVKLCHHSSSMSKLRGRLLITEYLVQVQDALGFIIRAIHLIVLLIMYSKSKFSKH